MSLNTFHLDDQLVIDEKINPICGVDSPAFEGEGHYDFLSRLYAPVTQLERQAAPIRSFEQAGPKVPVNLNCGTYRLFRKLVDRHAIL